VRRIRSAAARSPPLHCTSTDLFLDR
jgi:hypothetical protein